MLKVVKPSYEFCYKYLEMCMDYILNDDSNYTYSTLGQINKKIQSDLEYEQGIVAKECLPALSYWFFDDQNNIIGTSRLRPKLNERFSNIGGHIGYDVRPSFRNKGYGTQILQITLEKALSIGLKSVLITCDSDNIASQKIIEKNGGILLNKITDNSGSFICRYHIEIKALPERG
jgi:predicted acetyltransferase